MRVLKKINNNVVLAINPKGQQMILVGKGLGFQKTPYSIKDTSLIDHIFVNADNNKVMEIFNTLPTENILLVERIIEESKKHINKQLNKNLLITLSDHISFAIENERSGIVLQSPLELDIQYLYPQEVKVGKIAVEMINKELNISLPTSEYSSIALHFINAEHDLEGMHETLLLTEIISTIVEIVKSYFTGQWQDDSIYYLRFITHIRYFVLRQKKGIVLPDNPDEFTIHFVTESFKDLSSCVNDIENYIKKNFKWEYSNEEKKYLMIHLYHLLCGRESHNKN